MDKDMRLTEVHVLKVAAIEGWTMRDEFAARAMQGLLANPNVNPETGPARFYAWADAMLAARAEPAKETTR